MDLRLILGVCALGAVVLIGTIACFVLWQVFAAKSKPKVEVHRQEDRSPPPERRHVAAPTITQLIGTIRTRSLLEGAALREAESLAEQRADPAAFVAELVKRGRLTPYQADELAHGRGEHLGLGSYVLLEPIGTGGMGQVFRAKQNVLERECALKIIRKDRLQSSEAVERFLREARAAAKLKHPNIVTIYDANVADGTHYLAMELLHGTTLADRVKEQGPLSVGAACRYLRQAALGLQHAGEQGLVHRDIKPANLFIEQTHDQVKVLDLGLARIREVAIGDETATGDLTKEGEVMGTPDYMAPEQALDPRSADHRADIYSLGCTLYFLIAGRPPFAGGSMTEKLLAHQQKEPIALETLCIGVPAGVVAAIKKAMAKQPADRFQSPAEFAAALAPFENAENIVAAANVPVTSIAQQTKQRPRRETTTAPSLDVAKKPAPSSKAGWLIVLAVLGFGGCCVVLPLGFLGWVGLFPEGDVRNRGEGKGMVHEVQRVKPPAGHEIRRIEGRSFRLSRDGARIIHSAGANDHVAVLATNFEPYQKLFSLPDGYQGIGFADDKPPSVVASSLGKTIHLLHGDTGKELSQFPLPQEGIRLARLTADGKSALILQGPNLALWDLDTGKETKRLLFDASKVNDFVISSDNAWVLTGSQLPKVQLWSLTDGTEKRVYIGHDDFGKNLSVTCVALSPDKNHVLAGCGSEIYVWDTEVPQKYREVQHHDGEVLCAAFEPDNGTFLTGGRDQKVRYWSIQPSRRLWEFEHAGIVNVVAYLDSQRVISASQDKTIRFWSLPR